MFFGILLVKYSPNIPPSESAVKGNLCLLAMFIIPLTNSLALDRFYIGNKFAVVKFLVNFFTFGLSAGVWWIIDLIKVLNCTMLDKNDKPVCKK